MTPKPERKPERSPGLGEVAGSIAEDWLTDLVIDRALPAKGENQAKRDAKDAANADSAFTVILTAAVGLLNTPSVIAAIASAGIAVPGTAAWATATTTAAAAVRIAWQKLSVQDRARIWRAE